MVIADPVQGGSSDIASCHGSSYPEAQNGYSQAEYIFDWRSSQYQVTGFTTEEVDKKSICRNNSNVHVGFKSKLKTFILIKL